jgi:protein involved in polysaccharide export with SLBB domain
MTGRRNPLFAWTGRLALIMMLAQPGLALAQGEAAVQRRLVPGDEIALTVPGRQELDGELTLDAAGRVTIDPVGEVSLSGLTLEEATLVLRRNLRLFYPDIDNIDLQLRSASEVTLYAIGAFRAPGHYEFSALPSLWELVRAAGGPADDANLRISRVVRQESGSTTVFTLDLSGLLTNAELPVFELRSGDTLAIPGATATDEGGSTVPGLDGVQVFGGVGTPAVVPIDEPTLLMDILMRAGSPSDAADLTEVWWVHQTGGGYVSNEINVRSFLEDGDPEGNPLIHPGDTVEVRISEPSWVQQNLPLILGTILAGATVVLAWNTVANSNN